jgi:hypothetical protein
VKKFLIKPFYWVLDKVRFVLVAISIALYNTENEILKADPNDLDERNNHTQRMRSGNKLLEKFYAGDRDEKYVKDYYEVLKKADKFIQTSTPLKYATTADKFSMDYAGKDKWGRRYGHFGFFDESHKHAGKTLGEVLQLEMEERRLKDDDLPILYMFNNAPIEEGLGEALGKEIKEGENGFTGLNTYEKAKIKKFPMTIHRENMEAKNKIEQLTDFLHVKRIDEEYRYYEFYIPTKYKLNSIPKDSVIFKELINFDEILIIGKYGEFIGFSVERFEKHVVVDEHYEVLKFFGKEMKVMQ